MDAARGSLHGASRLRPAWMPHGCLIVLSFWGITRFLLYFILSYPTVFYFIGLLLAVYWFCGTGRCVSVTSHNCMNTAAEALSKTANIREFPTEFSRTDSLPQKLEVSFVS